MLKHALTVACCLTAHASAQAQGSAALPAADKLLVWQLHQFSGKEALGLVKSTHVGGTDHSGSWKCSSDHFCT